VTFNHERLAESHIRPVKTMLDMLMNRENKSLTETRKPEKRLVDVCHHFAKLLSAMLRVKGIPARMRYGFGNYFTPGRYEDHSLCEYWHVKEKRWALADPQFDDVWRSQLHIRHDAMDFPRGCFVTPAEAWKQCREGRINPEAFGIFELRGLWFIAGNLDSVSATSTFFA
jgi:hypothetical protein